MSIQDEIALSLSHNLTNEFCVPLSFLATLIRCHDYDQAVNAERRLKGQNLYSASEVGKFMVQSTAGRVKSDKAIAKMAETRRQILGVSRKLPHVVFEYFRNMMSQDKEGLQVALTMSNLRAVPRKLQYEEYVYLTKRMVRFYENCLPTPKPLHGKDVPDQVVSLHRAQGEIEKFMKLCDYEKLPAELATIENRMLCTQILDDELAENTVKEQLFAPIVDACRKFVPGGTDRLTIADRKLSGMDHHESKVGNRTEDTAPVDIHYEPINDAGEEQCLHQGNVISGTDDEDNPCDTIASSTQEQVTRRSTRITASKKRVREESFMEVERGDEGTEFESVEQLSERFLPVGWHMVRSSSEDFARQDERWKLIEGKTDLVIYEIPKAEHNDSWIRNLVRHCGLGMKLTGVSHIFCSFLHFGKVYSAAIDEGMEMMMYPMLYVEDPAKMKKLTLGQQPQEGSRCAAVFWRSPDKGTKHHFSSTTKYPRSPMPGWINIVTNVVSYPEKLLTREGREMKVQHVSKDLMSYILQKWCKPGGLCYNPRSGSMGTGMACYEHGIQYIALENDEILFDAASRRLLDQVKNENRKRPKMLGVTDSGSNDESFFCSIGKTLCKMQGQRPTYKCKSCKNPMHDICDWAKVVKKMPLSESELVSVCSETCHAREFD